MSTSHILPLPIPVVALRGLQLLVAIVILGLSAWGLSAISFDAASLALFTAIITLIITIYNVVSFFALKDAYNYWASLGLDIFAIIFWITSMGLMASWVSAFHDIYYNNYTSCYAGYCFKRDILPRYVVATDNYLNAMKAIAGLAGLEVILFIITLVFTGLFLHKHRAAGGHAMPQRAGTAAPSAPAGEAVATGGPIPPQYHERKDVEMEAGAPPPQQQYQQPQVPQQTYQQPQAPQQFAPQQQYPVYTAPTPTAPVQQAPPQ